jgi:hypothetical protein
MVYNPTARLLNVVADCQVFPLSGEYSNTEVPPTADKTIDPVLFPKQEIF